MRPAPRVVPLRPHLRAKPLTLRLVGFPEIDAAIRAGDARLLIILAASSNGLGAAPIQLEPGETIALRTQLNFEDDPGRQGEVVLLVKSSALPRLKVQPDDPRIAELVRALARGVER